MALELATRQDRAGALWIGTDLQSILFGEYLDRPYAFYARTPSAVLYNNVIHETTRATMQILQNAFVLVTNVITALFIVASLAIVANQIAADPLQSAIGLLIVAAGLPVYFLWSHYDHRFS